jgi:hypothetical protein
MVYSLFISILFVFHSLPLGSYSYLRPILGWVLDRLWLAGPHANFHSEQVENYGSAAQQELVSKPKRIGLSRVRLRRPLPSPFPHCKSRRKNLPSVTENSTL